jgi:HK97 family phage prohead protease
MEDNKFSFVVSDESLNKYGTRVLTEGIDLREFKTNPVLFWNHKRDEETMFGTSAKNHYPIGRWENLRTEGGQLIADAVLDMNDPTGKKVAQKLKDGFIKAASIGIAVHGTSDSPDMLFAGQTRPTITNSKLLEISIVDIPANGNALKLSYEGQMLRLDANENVETLNALLPIVTLGAALGRLLDETIDDEVTDDRTRGDIIDDMAGAAGIAPDTVRNIINGSIDCPPLDRLEGFAETLSGVSINQLISAAERDGCEYNTENSMSVAKTVTEALNMFFDKLKTEFNFSPKDKETTEEKAAEKVSELFVELNTSLESIKLPEPKDNSGVIAELKSSNESLQEQFKTLQTELITLKGQKSSTSPTAENSAPGGQQKNEGKTAEQLNAEKAGNFFKKQFKKR